ncbi:MAG: methyltransferase domain-containing protein [Patescibacteria group bacterium]|jgi:ubiquinone/menaquinone biosynthesis C-methylase UbiE
MQKQKPISLKAPSFLNPKDILRQSDIAQNMIVADLGCGSGYMTFAASKLVGPSGIVYAVDVQKAVLSGIRSDISFYGARNVKPVWADIEVPNATGISNDSVDLVMLVMNLYQSKKPDMIFAESYRMTKPGGKLLVVDWRKEAIPVGPNVNERIAYDVVLKHAKNAGFSFVKDIKTDEYHYGLIFKK